MGLMPDLLGSIGKLEATKIRLELQAEQEQESLESFQVHPQYRQIEERANLLTTSIHELTNANLADRRMVRFYEESTKIEKLESIDEDIQRLYHEVGLIFPEKLVHHLDEASEFHRRIVANRREFLSNEITRLGEAILDREQKIKEFVDERAKLLKVLESHGALEEFVRLQQNHIQLLSKIEDIRHRIENLKKFHQGKASLRIQTDSLQLEMLADYEDRIESRERAVSLFNANSEALYDVPGRLDLDIGKTGFKFSVDIERSTSQGIEQMKVFCYDLMLAQIWSMKCPNPGFLVHDSPIFDGVDERQKALALERAAQEAEKYNFQYICLMNSDMIPWKEFSESFDLMKYRRATFTDADVAGGLLGIRF